MEDKFVLIDLFLRNECDIVKGKQIEELAFVSEKMMEDWDRDTKVTVKYPH